jgi:flagellar hook assembly protein FlgD
MRRATTLLAGIISFLLAGHMVADTNVSGTISTNTTWTLASSPYIVIGDVSVGSGSTPVLTIQAGVTVKFNSGKALLVGYNSNPAGLQAIGTSNKRITFTANTGSPTAGFWKGIQFYSGTTSTSRIAYATVSYGGDSATYRGGIAIESCSPTVENSTVQSNAFAGISVKSGGAIIRTSTITANSGDGISVATPSTPTLNTLTITNNTGFAATIHAKVTLTAASGLTASGNGTNGVQVYLGAYEVVDADTTWRNTGIPYVATTTIDVRKPNSGTASTLTIAPGVIVKFNAGTWLQVGYYGSTNLGGLQAIGTSSQPITFTANSASPTAGFWKGVQFYSGTTATSRIAYATVSYGGDPSNYRGGIALEGCSPTIENSTVQSNASAGITLKVSGSPTIRTSTITANGGIGIIIGIGTSPTLQTLTISNNTGAALNFHAKVTPTAVSGLTLTGNTTNAAELWHGSYEYVDINTTWKNIGVPYVVTTLIDVRKPNGGTASILTIEPGVILKFNAGTTLQVGWYGSDNPGELQAIGTSTQPITFTANSGSPTAGFWKGVQFYSGTTVTSRIAYATVNYGGDPSSYRGGIAVEGCSPTVENTTVQNNASAGITLKAAGSPIIRTSTITANSGDGISIGTPSTPTLNTLTITNNTGFALTIHAKVTVAAVSGLTASGNGTNGAQVYLGAYELVDADTTWRNLGIPYVATTAIDVRKPNSGTASTLTIAPGVIVKFNAGTWLQVGYYGSTNLGGLQAIGTSTQPIIFTANSASPTAGFWKGVQFYSGTTGTSRIAYATISYGGVSGSTGGIRIDNSGPTLDHATIQNSAYSGIHLLGTTSPTIVNCSFAGNPSGIYNSAPTNAVNARLNYWSAANGPSGSGPGSGQSVSTGVNFEPWLVADPAQPQYFTTFSEANRTFNPAISVNTTITTSTTETGNWTATIKNASSMIVRTISGTGSNATIVWNGKNDSGVDQPDATYTYELASTSTISGGVATHAQGATIIDRTKQLTITGLALDQAFFSPNGDAIQDTAKLTGANPFDDTSWTLNIRNSTGAIVRANVSTGLSLSFTWDGRNGSGAMQPDDIYTLETIVSNGTASVTSSPTTTLDNTLPAVSITNPANGQILSNVYQSGVTDIDVNGSVGDTNLTTWVLEQGNGAAPISWDQLASGYSPVSNAKLFTWVTLPLTNALYSLRIRAWDRAGNWGFTQITSTVGNFKVSQSTVQINAGAGNTVTYTSAIPFTLTQTLVVKNAAGQTVRTLVNGSRPSGSYPDAWNGRSDGSALLPDGPYFYAATVTDGAHTLTWDLTSQYSNDFAGFNDGLNIQPFDPFNNLPMTFSYNFSQPGQVSIGLTPNANGQVPSNCNTPNFCLAFNKYEESGPHTVAWAGVDDTGIYRPDIRKIGVVTQRYLFSKNAVVVFGTKPAVTNVTVTPAVFGPARGTQTVAFDLATYQNQTVSVAVSFLNQTSRSVLRAISLPNEPAGHQTAVWDGRADNGVLMAPGFYTVTVTATDAIGNQSKGQILTTIEY